MEDDAFVDRAGIREDGQIKMGRFKTVFKDNRTCYQAGMEGKGQEEIKDAFRED